MADIISELHSSSSLKGNDVHEIVGIVAKRLLAIFHPRLTLERYLENHRMQDLTAEIVEAIEILMGRDMERKIAKEVGRRVAGKVIRR